MLTSTPNLQIFIEPAPTVGHNAVLATVLKVFSPTQDRVVVLNAASQPVGIIHLRSFTPYLMASLATQTHQDSPETQTPAHTGLDLQQPLYASVGLLESLPSLRADLSLSQLGPHFLEHSDSDSQNFSIAPPEQSNFLANNSGTRKQEWAIVSATGEFLGLLDRYRLLEFLANQYQVSQNKPAANPLCVPFFASLQNQPQPNEDTACLETLHTLIEIFDLLPLPLCLETSTGSIIACNQAYALHFQDSQDPHIQRSFKALETDNSNHDIKTHSASDFPPLTKQTISSASRQTATTRNSNFSETPSGEFAYSWGVCVIPAESEKVWQFVKMPLNIAMRVQNTGSLGSQTTTNSKQTTPETHSHAAKANQRKGFATPASDHSPENEKETVCLVLAQDVTEYQQIAKELAAKNADLVQLNRLKDDFLACISHELKTPLTAVLGLSSLLKDQTIGQLNERQARYARLIYQSGRHLMVVVNDILDLTRMESGQMELLVEPVNVSTVCERAVHSAWHLQPTERGRSEEELGSEAYQNNFPPGFTLSIEPNLEIMVADELRLRQMLVNLLSNAFKFTEPNGKVGLKVSLWEGWIAFTVWDTGIGIPDDKQHLIFQKFQQLENPLTRRFEGVGLGLVVARGLARLHGGDVTFISCEGKGSEFTLLLPPQPPEQNSTPRTSSSPRHRLVLIVEAVPRFIEQLSSQLTSLGYRVVIARTGTEALDKARRFSPEVIFLNPVLPMLSGWDVLTLLKSDAVTCNIPTVIAATQAEKEQAFQLRADGFLRLPVQLEALRGVLAKLGSQHQERTTRLTVLRLNIRSCNFKGADTPTTEEFPTVDRLNNLLHQYDYRVLEAEDLEGAEMLARVWQPDVVLLDSGESLSDADEFFKKYSQNCPRLACLPLVTLDRLTTEAASLVPGLAVFPCLSGLGASSLPANDIACRLPEVLLGVIEQAAGNNSLPVICVLDFSVLPDLAKNRLSSVDSRNDWCQALLQYLQTAGYRGLMGQSWTEVSRQLETKSIDLLLINFRNYPTDQSVMEALTALHNLPDKPPILVVFQPSSEAFFGKGIVDQGWRNIAIATAIKQQESVVTSSGLNHFIASETRPSEPLLEPLLNEMATKVCSASLSMAELLEEIHSILKAQ
ncbi:ATP-binding protein [Ancylothrix sp. C2]|uniref:ATP-binding response regulator n=1 Tax=Ancylothrix sp. D3o TaxID=2953691 RepID=UPI0021BB496A|nr:ATP-binding protein [Ancylothrix sp. D3o]MCT7948544.1 ATP-binding protein [Ancylothrix sp. D3o]